MVVQLNDITGHHPADEVMVSRLDAHTYPEQDLDFIGKMIHIGYIDSNTGYRAQRLWINKNNHPEYTGENINSELEERWFIVRFDKIEDVVEELVEEIEDDEEEKQPDPIHTREGVVILLSSDLRKTVVTTPGKIKDLRYFPGYILKKDEVMLPFCDTWEEFNELYKNETIFLYQIQNTAYIKRAIFTEYWNDIKAYDSYTNHMPECPNQHITKEDVVNLLREHYPDKYELTPECILLSFPTYHPRHELHLVDIPRRAINVGIVIRCDERDGVIVILEYDENGSMRFVTDSECFIYHDLDCSVIPQGDYRRLLNGAIKQLAIPEDVEEENPSHPELYQEVYDKATEHYDNTEDEDEEDDEDIYS